MPSSHAPSVRPRPLVALLAVLAVLAALLTLPSPPPAAAASAAIGEGSLTWGVKASWRSYIGASGTTPQDGAAVTGDGLFSFPLASGSFDADTGTTELSFRGSIHFQAYCTGGACMLDTTYGNLRVVVSPTEQTLYGDWSGKPREGGALQTAVGVPLATLDIHDASVSTADGVTGWSGVVATATDRFVTYDVGTLLDPVSFSYRGEGAKPDLTETWDAPGTPVYRATDAAWWTTSTSATARRLLVSDAGAVHVVQQNGTGSARAAGIQSLDPATLAPVGTPQDLPVYNTLREPPVAYDARADAIYWFALPAPGAEEAGYTLHRSTWDAASARFDTVRIGAFPYRVDTARQYVYALTWNPAARQVALVTGAKDGVLRLFTARPDGGYAASEHPIPLPAAYDPALAAAGSYQLLYGSTQATEAESMLMPLADGSYLYTGGTGAVVDGQVVPVPVARYAVDGSALTVRSVPQSVPADSRQGYHGVARVGDEAIAYQRAGGLTRLSIDAPAAVAGGDPMRLAIPDSVEQGLAAAPFRDPATGLYVGVNGNTQRLVVFDGAGAVRASTPVERLHHGATRSYPWAFVPQTGSLYLQVRNVDGVDGFVRWERAGDVPRIAAQPADATAIAGASAPATFSVEATGSPAPAVQWQMRAPGQGRFSDIAGATTSRLRAPDGAVDGTQYRAVVSNRAGRIASDAATLTVQSRPVVTTAPASTTVAAGQDALFQVLGTGAPEPTVSWQRRTPTGWQELTTGDGFTVDGARLTVSSAPPSLDGTVVRAVLTNAVGATTSPEAVLTVRPAPSGPGTATTFTGVALEWTGSAELQSAPPFGGSSFFSAGVSDGSQGTYSAEAAGARILQRSAAGETPATWETRGAHTTGASTQVVRLTDGTAVVQPDGATRIAWTGAFSVNFYGGLVPFTVSDPVLTVGADGAGTLTADLDGYAGDMAHPTVTVPLDAAQDVVVATFSRVTVDTARGFTVAPDYAGVEVSVPAGQTAQNRTVAGWGSWPQSFVDFQVRTGLSSYWFSSGGSFDGKKPPAPFAVGFGDAIPVAPTPTPPPTAPEPVPSAPVVTPEAGASGAVEGSLVWGVKSSFRSYIAGPIAKGAISLSGGAVAQGGAFWFGQSATDVTAGSATGSTTYRGAVRFTGHGGILDLTVSDPVVRIDSPRSGTLLVRVGGDRLVEFGRLDLGAAARSEVAGGVAYSNVPVTLTSAGAGVFSYGSSQFYGPGTAMDPLSFVVGSAATSTPAGGTGTVVSASARAWTPPAAPPATTGLVIDDAARKDLRPGSRITVSGSGFLPGESGIKVVLYSEPVVLENDLAADGDGTATWTGLLPADLAPGEHTLTLQGSTSLGVVLTVGEASATVPGCPVQTAELSWGFKESFRAYISGSIAHGDWTVSDGATYATPAFGWSAGAGGLDPAAGDGRVSFPGAVHFTGHDGLLRTTIANPTLVFAGPQTAYLLLDVSGVTMDDALAGRVDQVETVTQVPFVTLDLAASPLQVSDDGTTVTATDVPASITSQGYAAFPNYPEGTAFDPVSFRIAVADCAGAAPAPLAVVEGGAGGGDAAPASQVGPSWVLWAGAALVLALLAVAAGWLVLRARRARGRETAGSDASAGSPGAAS